MYQMVWYWRVLYNALFDGMVSHGMLLECILLDDMVLNGIYGIMVWFGITQNSLDIIWCWMVWYWKVWYGIIWLLTSHHALPVPPCAAKHAVRPALPLLNLITAGKVIVVFATQLFTFCYVS